MSGPREFAMAKYDEEASDIEIRRPTALERLRSKKDNLEKQLDATNEAIAALEEHPEINEVLEKLAKARV